MDDLARAPCAEPPRLDARRRLLEEGQGLVELARGLVAPRQVVHAVESVGVGVLDSLANRDEECESLGNAQAGVVTIPGEGDALDVFHDEEGQPLLVVPPSSTLAMFGCSVRAEACRSASNHERTVLSPIPALMNFKALWGCSSQLVHATGAKWGRTQRGLAPSSAMCPPISSRL